MTSGLNLCFVRSSDICVLNGCAQSFQTVFPLFVSPVHFAYITIYGILNMQRTLRILTAISVAATIMFSQENTVIERLREQAEAIADSSLPKLAQNGVSAVELIVEGRGAKIVVQNGYLEALKRSGIIQLTDRTGSPGWARLRILIVGQTVHSDSIPEGRFRRTVRSVFEPRLEFSSSDIRPLGIYERITVDTVRSVVNEQIADDVLDESAFDRLMMPLIVGASVALAVYLLFTVRS